MQKRSYFHCDSCSQMQIDCKCKTVLHNLTKQTLWLLHPDMQLTHDFSSLSIHVTRPPRHRKGYSLKETSCSAADISLIMQCQENVTNLPFLWPLSIKALELVYTGAANARVKRCNLIQRSQSQARKGLSGFIRYENRLLGCYNRSHVYEACSHRYTDLHMLRLTEEG